MKKHIIIFLYLFSCFYLFGQQLIDTTLFQFDRKINNQYIKDEYAVTNNYIDSIFAIDINEYDNSYYYTAIIDHGFNLGFYLDDTGYANCIAYNTSNEERFLGYAGKVALTKSGRIYVVDKMTNEIYYWNKDNLGFSPVGKINFQFSYIQDIYCDKDDNLFILDINQKRIYKYSTTLDSFINFPRTDFYYTSYYNKYSSSWGQAAGIAVSEGNIYMIFSHSAILKLDESGSFVKYFDINTTTLGLTALSSKSASDTWLESINIGPYKNIYVLDTADQKIHIFDPGLEYICSWNDPSHPIGMDATDLCFAPGSYSLYVSHTWGAYEFLLQPGICGFSLDNSYLYPDCVNENYKGIGMDVSFVGQGNTKIKISGQGKEILLLNKYYTCSDSATHYRVYWDGKDAAGTTVPYGEYTVEFIFDEAIISTSTIDVISFPAVEILDNEYIEISRLESIDYNYRIADRGFLTITISEFVELNGISWENEIKSRKIYPGEYTEQIIQTDLPDGYYGINFNILPPALTATGAKPITTTACFSINDNELALGDPVLLAGGFSPNSITANKIGVQFTLSETALLSAHIYDETNNLITTILDKEIFSKGIKKIEWNGYNSQNQIMANGNYFFIIQAASMGLPDFPIQKQSSLFVLDATPLDLTIPDQKSVYYISPDEPSSIGVQDDFTISVNFNKEATVSAKIVNQHEVEIKGIILSHILPEGNDLFVNWNGMDNENMYTWDDRYKLEIKALDTYGNLAECHIPVIVDNNRIDEANPEGIIGLNEIQVNDDRDTFINCLSLEKITGGHVIAWNDTDYSDRYVVVYDDAGNIRRNQFSVTPDSVSFHWEYALSKTNNGFILIWLESDSGDHFQAQRFNEYGEEIGERFELTRMNNSNNGVRDLACKTTENGYAAAWIQRQEDNDNTLWVQFFNNDNKAITTPQLIAENTTDFVALESTGNNVMALWQGVQEGSTDLYTTYVKKIEQENPLTGTPVEVYTGEEAESTITGLNSGFVVTGSYPGTYITAIQLDDNGNITGEEIIINDRQKNNSDDYMPSVISITDGFIVTWFTYNWQIAVRRIAENFTPVGKEIILNTALQKAESPLLCTTPHGFTAIWLNAQEQLVFDTVISREFKLIHPIAGGSLQTEILNPSNESFPIDDIISVTGIIDDANMDLFTLSLIDYNNSVTHLITQHETNINGEIYFLDANSLTRRQIYTLKLEAWDKAGNYKNNSVSFIPMDNDTEFFLGDIIPLSDIFNPNSLTENTIEAQFTLNKPALISAYIYHESNCYITTLKDSEFSPNGINEIAWNGYNSQNQMLPPGNYYFKIDATPYELPNSQRQKQSSLFVLDTTPVDLILGDIILCSNVFYPDSDPENKIAAEFTLNKAANITAHIYDESNNHITTFMDNEPFMKGTKKIEWNGYDSQNQMTPTGNYFFRIEASPIDLPDSSIQKQSALFVLDTTPLELTIPDQKLIYYISPDEPSSIGIQDDLNVIINFNKEVTVSAGIIDQQEKEIKEIISYLTLPAGNDLSINWNGTDSGNMYVPDNRYELEIKAFDSYGTLTEYHLPVIVDNNQSAEGSNFEGIMGFNEFQVDDDTDTVINGLSSEKIEGGYVIAWNDLDYQNRNIVVYDDAGNIRRNQWSVNPGLNSFAWEYSLSRTDNGFILIWITQDGASHFDILQAQRFDPYGEEIGQRFELFRVAHSINGMSYLTSKTTDNGYVVAWIYQNKTWAQFFDNFDTAITAPVLIAENTTGFVKLESAGKEVMALWQAARESTPDVYTTYVKRIVQDDPLAGSPVEIYTGSEAKSVIVKLNSGFAVVGPYHETYITAIELNENGTRTGKEIIINDQYYNHNISSYGIPAVISIDSDFMVAWHTTEWRIAARRIDSNFSPVGREILLDSSSPSAYYPVLCPTDNSFTAAWLYYKEKDPNPDSNRYLRAINSRKFNLIHPVMGGSLQTEIFTPLNDSCPLDDIISVTGIIDDANIDMFTLSLIDNSNNVTHLYTRYEENINGEIYSLDTASLTNGQEYTLELEAWDKAGNYRSHSIAFVAQHTNEDYLLTFYIPDPYCSETKSLPVVFTPAMEAFVEFTIINSSNAVVNTMFLGSQPASPTLISLPTTDMEEGDFRLRIKLTAMDDSWTYERINIFYIDNTLPEIIINDLPDVLSDQINVDVQLVINETYFKNMLIEILDAENNIIQSKGSLTIIETYSFKPSVLAEGSYNFRVSATDKSGNQNQTIKNMNIDRTGPIIDIISPQNNEIGAGTIHIEANLTDETELSEYRLFFTINSGEENLLQSGNDSNINLEWDSGSVIIDISQVTLRFLAIDIAGNESEETISFTVFNQKPMVDIQFNCIHFYEDMQYFVNGENQIELSAATNPEYTGIKNIYYSYTSPYQNMQIYSDPIALPNGTYEFHYYAEDLLGNQSNSSIVFIQVDTTPPELSHIITNAYDLTAPVFYYITDTGTYISSCNYIEIDCTEEGFPQSGIASLEYKIDDGQWISQQEVNQYKVISQKLFIQLFDEGSADITIKAADRVNNVSEELLGTFIIDNTPPITELQTNFPLMGTPDNYSAEPGLLCNWTANDSASGILKTVITINDEPLSEDDVTYTFTEEGTYAIDYYSVDNVGNSEEVQSIVIKIEQPDIMLGDVDSDGEITIIDALVTAQYYVDINPANFNPALADVNCDGSIDIVDALLIAQYYVDLISSFCT